MAFFSSCKKSDNSEPTQPIEPERKELHLQLKNKNLLSLKRYSPQEKGATLAETELETYFGNRLSYTIPEEIITKNDSVFLVKKLKLTEGFKAKWENENLLYQPSGTTVWKKLGQQDKDQGFVLHMRMYKKESTIAVGRQVIVDAMYDSLPAENFIAKGEDDFQLIFLQLNAIYK
ncbi:hypothetical protein ACL9RF_02925 [Sphingobacterium sp. Mn56C]